MAAEELLEQVRDRYAEAARAVVEHKKARCCGPEAACCGPEAAVFAGQRGHLRAARYTADELGGLPAEAVAASLGCGNPLIVAVLQPGERVLDLGSGGGIDVLLSARRVGPTGFAYGAGHDRGDARRWPAPTRPRPARQRRVPQRHDRGRSRCQPRRSTW